MDITLCTDKTCIFKKTCRRFNTISNHFYQSYFMESPFNDDELDCDYYSYIFTINIFDVSNIKRNRTLIEE